MKKNQIKKLSVGLIVTGAVLFIVSIIIAFSALDNTYGLAGCNLAGDASSSSQSCNNNVDASLKSDKNQINISNYLRVASGLTALMGGAGLFYASKKPS